MDKQISLEQYRGIDLSIFAVLGCALEFFILYAAMAWFPSELYVVSLIMPIFLLVSMRWNGWAVVHLLLMSVIYCLACGALWQQYLIYIVGNCFALFVLILYKKVGKQKLISKWFWVAVMTAVVFVPMQIGRAATSCIVYASPNFFNFLLSFASRDVLSAVLCMVILLIARKQNGLFEDQIDYLRRIQREREQKQQAAAPITQEGMELLGEHVEQLDNCQNIPKKD